MRVLGWLVRALLFFFLLVFALKNQHVVPIHGLYGLPVDAPMILVLLGALLAGIALGISAMLPAWWRLKRQVRKLSDALPEAEKAATAPVPLPDVPLMDAHPPRDGL